MNSIKSESYSFLVSRKNIMISDNYIQYVYDITIAYGGEHIVESEMELLKSGIFPEVFLLKMTIWWMVLLQEVHFDVKRYPIEDVPLDAEESALWLQDIWRNKESVLKRCQFFYFKKRLI